MTIYLVPQPDYVGEAGINAIRNVQRALIEALKRDEWEEVRRLDRLCALLVDRVIAANSQDKTLVVRALTELKGVYASLVAQCDREVTLLHAT